MTGIYFKVDDRNFSSFIKEVESGMRTKPEKTTESMALQLKKYIRNNIEFKRRASMQWGSHNTPVKLISMLHSTKTKDGHIVFFDQFQDGVELPLIVEEGTNPHEQPNNPIYAATGHPGAKPRYIWRDATQSFIERDADFFVKKLADDLVGR